MYNILSDRWDFFNSPTATLFCGSSDSLTVTVCDTNQKCCNGKCVPKCNIVDGKSCKITPTGIDCATTCSVGGPGGICGLSSYKYYSNFIEKNATQRDAQATAIMIHIGAGKNTNASKLKITRRLQPVQI
jgi:hypothetical protein